MEASAPNAVTVLGITFGGPLVLPTCSNDKKHPETCSNKLSNADTSFVELGDGESKNYPWPGLPGCGYAAEIRVSLSDDKVVGLCIGTLGTTYHDAVLDALIQKFGKPEMETTQSWYNRQSRQFSTPYIRWRTSGLTVVLHYNLPYGDGAINITDDNWAKEIEGKKRSTNPYECKPEP